MSYSGLKERMRHNRAVFESHADRRMDQMVRDSNREKLKQLQECGDSCKTCSNRQKKGLGLFCKAKKKVVQVYNICEKHVKAPVVAAAA